jgi:hypothetical protein
MAIKSGKALLIAQLRNRVIGTRKSADPKHENPKTNHP